MLRDIKNPFLPNKPTHFVAKKPSTLKPWAANSGSRSHKRHKYYVDEKGFKQEEANSIGTHSKKGKLD